MLDSKIVWADMHEDAWWMKVLDNTLSPDEERAWQAHLQECGQCRAEWEALAQVDMLLSLAPEVPQLSEAFTAQTTERVWRSQRRQRWLAVLAGSLIVGSVGVGVYLLLGSAVASLEQGLVAVFVSREILFWSLMRVALNLVTAWRAVLPYLLAVAGFGLLLVMPNGMLATLVVFWLARRQQPAPGWQVA